MVTSHARALCATSALLTGAALAGCAALGLVGERPRREIPPGATAPLFHDLGDHQRAVTTSVPMAQRYFDQGLVLTYDFNHAEAVRSFREAQRLDPSCAMCFWGEAYALGPNINKPMDVADAPRAFEVAREAQRLAASATPVESRRSPARSSRATRRRRRRTAPPSTAPTPTPCTTSPGASPTTSTCRRSSSRR
jgi:hypothetical protein